MFCCKILSAYSKASDIQARNLHKFLSKFLHSCVDEQYPSIVMATLNHRNLLENLGKIIA